MTLSIVILAAGQGKRMHSQLPKVLHRLAGKTLLEHIVETANKLNPVAAPIIIYGHQGDKVRHALAHLNVTWIEQTEQLGTGHALQQALPHLPAQGNVLVLYGDVPLTSVDTLKSFILATHENSLGIITATLPNPHGLGRILRDEKNAVTRIVEERDTTPEQRALQEINSGIYLLPLNKLPAWLAQINNSNSQQEFYLTDIIPFATKENIFIHTQSPQHYQEILGVNNRVQLAELERFYQTQQAEKWMLRGVTLLDPNRFDVRGEVSISQDVVIDINVILEGNVSIGQGCTIGANTILRNVVIGERVEIKANSIIDGAEIAADCTIGPFARIRPGTILSAHSHIGNFVEIKNSVIGTASKVNHLSYIGDSEIGKQVNVGAGTITCNYDGINKHKTTIGDNAFIGSNTSLIAPIIIGENATIGAGSTISRAAPAHQLTISRGQQRTITNWQRPKKEGD